MGNDKGIVDELLGEDIVEQASLPPSQYLMLEVLAARYRLGAMLWTFPLTDLGIARALESKNLVQWKHGISERTIRVWLTEAGKKCCLGSEVALLDPHEVRGEMARRGLLGTQLSPYEDPDTEQYVIPRKDKDNIAAAWEFLIWLDKQTEARRG